MSINKKVGKSTLNFSFATLRYLAVFLFCFLSFAALAQPVSISYPSSAQSINRVLGKGSLTVKLFFNGACTGTSVKVALPASVSYIASSVSKTGGAAGLSISESSITDLRNPVFTISGTISSGDEITFKIDRKAECGTLTTGKDSIFVTTGGGCFSTSEVLGTVNTYNILSPSLSINPAPSLTGAVIDTTATRLSTIINGGNGVTDTLRFFIVYTAAGLVNTSGTNTISANTVSFSPYRTSGDTLFYKIFGSTIFGGDSLLSNGETVIISEPIKVLKCNATTNYGVAWGRNDASICAWSYANNAVIAATGAPNFNLLTAAQVGFSDKCTSYDYEMTFYNSGLGNRKAATMYDLKVQQGHWASSVTVLANMDTSLFSITDFSIGTSALTFTYTVGIINIDLNNVLTSDPDGAGVGIEDIDGDGFYDDLPNGHSIKLTAKIALKCNRSCGSQNYNYSVAAILKYRTMCSSTISTSDVKLSTTLVNYLYETAFFGKSYVPANVVNGVPFRVNLKAGFSVNQDSYSSSNTRYRWKMILPLGFSVATVSNPRYGFTSVTYTLSGDTIIFTSGSNNLDSFSINLVYTCGSNGYKTINYTLEKINNIVTGCKCQGDLICASVTTHAFCPMPCPSGPTTYVPKVKRTDSCIGWTDYTIRTRVNPLLISEYDLSKALYLDTINIFGSAIQNDISLNLFVELTLPKTTIAPTGVNKLTPIQTQATFFRAGVILSSCVVSTYSGTATTASTQSVVYDLTSCVLAMGGLSVGDSIAVVSTYVVATNNNLPKNDVQSGGTWTFYNKDATGLKAYCNTTVPEMYLVGTDLVNATNAYITGGCTGTTLGGSSNYLARRFNTSGELFKNEFRPVMYVDSFVATMPVGYVWNYTHFQPAAGPVFNFLAPTISGSRYSFVNPGTWQPLGLTITNAYGGYVPFNVSPLCGTLPSENINFKIYIRDYYYAYANKSTPSGLAYVLGGSAGQTRAIAYTASQKPDIDLIDQTGIVPAIKDSLNWNLRIYNKGLNAANYTWIAIPYNPAITVNKITEIATGTVLVPIAYGGGYWYQLGATGIGAGSSKDYKIDFKFSACVSDSLEVFAGWNCGAYPSDPTTYPCTSVLDRIALKVAAVPSEVQLSVIREPGGGGTVNLCTTDSILLVVNSAQTANLKEPYVVVYPPLGFTVSSIIKVEYPLGSGNYQNATVSSISGGGVKIDLTSHSGIGLNGLLGTATSSSTYTPIGGDRQAKVKLDYTTDCDLTSGYSFVFYAFGKMPCGQLALGNGVSASTTALNITGATTGGIAGATMGISAGSLSCGTSTTVSLTTTPSGMPTQLGDTMMYILPASLKYDSSFVKGANCDSCKIRVESGSAGTTVVKVKLQTSIAAGSAIAFSFNVLPKGIGCSSVTIPGYFKRNISALMCDTVLCSNSSIFLTSLTSSPISVKKPNIQLSSYVLLDTNVWVTGGGLNKIKIKYANTGTLAYAANTDSVELFCGASTTPFAILPLTKSLAISAVDSDIYFVSVPSSACSAADLVTTTAKVRKTTVNGTEQCICDSAQLRMSVMPTVGPALTYCQWSVAPALTATGTSLKWYTVATGGLGSTTAIVPATNIVGVKSYYVSQTSSIGIEGPRAEIKVTILRTPEEPIVSTPFEYCQGALASILSATKALSSDTLLWYSPGSGSIASYTAPIPSTTTAGSFYYFVKAKSNAGCEGPKDSIEVIVNPKPSVPIVTSPVKYCLNATATALSAIPVDINDTLIWYDSAIGGIPSLTAPIPSTSLEDTFTYWVSAKTSFGCEGPRDSIKVIIYPNADKPVVITPVTYCVRDSAIRLSATASYTTDTLLWYTSGSGGIGSKTNPLPSTAIAGTTKYWVSAKTIHNCEGLRDSVEVIVNPSAGRPRVTTPVIYCLGATATSLSAIKSSSTDTLLWYTTIVGGVASYTAPIPSTSVEGTTTYYVSGKSNLGCEGRRESIDVVVNPIPELPIVISPVNYCIGEVSSELSAYDILGDTILWYSSALGGTYTLTTPIPSTTSLGSIKYYVGVKNTFGCFGPIDSIEVFVNPLAAKPTVTTPVTYCQGESASALSATKALASDILVWYSSASGGTGSTTAPTPSTATVGTTTYWVSAKTNLNCEGPRDSINVVVNRTPSKPLVTTPVTYCQGESASALSATKAIASDTLIWYSSASGGTGTTSAPTPSTATVGTTTYWVSAKTNLNCESQRDSINVVVNRTPSKPIVTTPVTYCQGATAASLTAIKAIASDTLVWYSSASGGTGSTTAPTPSTVTVGTTTYWVSAKTNLNCEGPRDSINVVVNRTPSKPLVTTPVTYCQGATAASLTAIKAIASDTLIWYSSASGGTGSATAPTPSTATVGTTTYWVSAKTNLNCESQRDSINVVVNRTPSKPIVTTPVTYCQGASASALTATKAIASDTLIWYSSASGGTGTTTAPTPSTATVGTTTYWVSAKTNLNCEGPRDSINVVVNRTPSKPLVTTPVTYCQGATAASLTAIKAIASDTLIWYSSASGGTGSATAPTPSTATVGTTTYWVSAKTNLNCESQRDSINVVVNRTPSKPIVTTPVTYCQGASASALTATKAIASDTLVWYSSASGGTGSTTAPTPSTATVGTTTYWVSAKTNLNCEGPRDSINVVVNRTPSKPLVTTPVTYCQGATAASLTAIKAIASDTLVWYSSASGGTGSTTAPTPSTATVGTTTYWVSAKTNLNCEGPRDSINVVVNRTPSKPIVTTPVTYCQGESASALSAIKTLASDTLVWYSSASGGTGSTTAPTPSTATVGTTTYWVSAKTNLNCEGPRDSINVVVNRTPSKPLVTTPVTYCQGATAASLTAIKAIASDTLIWYISASGGTGSTTAPTPSTATVGTTTYWVSAKTNLNCEGPRDSINVVVNRTPSKPIVVSLVLYCQGATASALSATKAIASDTLVWYSSASGGTGSTTAPTPSTATVGTTTYWVSAKTNLNCEGPRDSINVMVNATPTKPIVISPVSYCQGATATPLTAAKLPIDTLLWYSSASGGSPSRIAPIPSTVTLGTTTYWVSVKNAPNCEGPRDSINVVVNRTPSKPIVTTPVTYCQGATAASLTAIKAIASDTLIWYSSASGGTGSTTAPTPSTATVGTTTYWVSAKTNLNCEGPRDSINVVVNRTPSKPLVTTPVTYCQGATAASLTAIKAIASDTLIWYSSASGGTGSATAPTPSTATVGTTTYWVSAKTNLNCESQRDSINVVVNRTPSKPIVTTPVTYCQGASASALTATKAIASDTLIWYSSASGGTGTTTAPTPSTATVGTTTYWVSAKTNLNCEGPRDSINVVVNRTPSKPLVTTPVTYCQGATAASLTAIKAIASDTLIWYSSASGGTGSATAPTPSTATVGTTTYWVSAKTNLNCESQRDSINVVVNRTPSKPIVTTPVTYCQGASASALTATKAIASDTLVWYSSASGGTGSTTAPTPSTATVGTTTYWVSAKTNLNCEGPRDSINVVVNRTPSKPLVTTPVTYCQGATAASLTAIKAIASDTLVWYSSASGGTGSTTAPTPSTATVGTTTYWVSAKTNLNCEGPRDSINVVVNRTPSKPIVTTPVTYCQGESASALSAIKTLASDTLVWYSSASGGTGSTTAPTPSTATVGTTTYWVSAKTNLNCEGPRDSINVVVNRTPSKPLVTTPVTYCQGATAASLTAIKAIASDTLIWYISASGGTGSTTAPTPSTATVGTTTYWVSAKTNLNCEGPRDSINVVVNRTPSKPIVVSLVLYCQGATASALSATKAIASDTLVWYSSASGGTGSTTAPTPSTATVGTTTYWVSAKTNLNCEGPRDSINVMVNATPTKPIVISPVSYCQGATATPLTAAKLPIDTLLWYSSASGGSPSRIAPIPSTVTLGTTTYWVSVKNAPNCEGPRDSINVVVNRTPSKPIVTTPVTYCQGATAASLTAIKAIASDTLIWYSSASGGTGSTTAPTPSTATVGTTTYWVSAKTNLNCEGPRDSINVVVNRTPSKPLVTTPVTYCQGATAASLTAIKAIASDTLIWYSSASGGTGSATAPTPSTATVGTTTYWVSAKTNLNCESQRDSINVVVNRTPSKPIVTTPVTYCQGASASALTATKAIASDTLIWYSSASGGTGTTTAPTPSTATVGTTTYWVSAKTNLNCEGPRDSINVVVNRTPSKPIVVSLVLYCQGATASALSATKAIASDTLVWYSSASGGTGSTTAPTPSTATVGTTTYWVSAKTNLNCEGPRDSINVMVNPTPLAPIVISPVVYCQNDAAIALTATKAFISDTLNWYTVATGGTRSLVAPVPNTAVSGTTTYYVSIKNNSACEGPRAAIIVTVNPAPTAPGVTTPLEYCEASLAPALSASGTLLKWYTTATGGTASSIAPTPSTSLPGTTIFYVSQTNPTTGCEGARSSISVTINPLPLAPTVTSPLNLCIGGPSAAIGAVGIGLKWYTVPVGGTPSSTAPSASTASIGTTNFYVSQTSLKGCEGPRALMVIIVNPLPTVTITSLAVSGFVYCRGKSTTLKAVSATATNYQWEFNSKLKMGAIYDTIAADSTGKWGVTVYDTFGCSAKAQVDVREDTSALPVLSPTEVRICQESSVILTCHPGFVGYLFELHKDGIPISVATNKENLKTVSDSGVYFVRVTNNYGCVDTTNNAYVDYYPKPPKPTITLTGTWLETFGVYRYYQWYKNDKPIIGAHAKKYNTTGPGYYFLEITDANGCLNQSDTLYIGNTTNLVNSNIQQQLKLYPNPTKDRIIVESPIKVNIQVMNMVGQIIVELSDAHIVDLSTYADGTYVFRISDQDNRLIGIEKVFKLTNP